MPRPGAGGTASGTASGTGRAETGAELAERQRYEAEVAEVLADAAWHAVMACRRGYRVAVQEWQLAYRRAIECGALDDEHGAAEFAEFARLSLPPYALRRHGAGPLARD